MIMSRYILSGFYEKKGNLSFDAVDDGDKKRGYAIFFLSARKR